MCCLQYFTHLTHSVDRLGEEGRAVAVVAGVHKEEDAHGIQVDCDPLGAPPFPPAPRNVPSAPLAIAAPLAAPRSVHGDTGPGGGGGAVRAAVLVVGGVHQRLTCMQN